MDGGPLPTSLDVEHAQARLAGRVRRTPVLALDGSELGVAGRVVLKLEYLQHTGTFKPRGALNALLSRAIPDGGVVAASGGNHGLGVAWAAAHLGVPATIFVPSTSPTVKADRIRDAGAHVTTVTGTYSDALAAARDWSAGRDVVSVHAFDDPDVVAGQGTLAREIAEQVPDLTNVLVTVGGGGLAAGTLLGLRDPNQLIPVEPTACPTLHAALAAGQPVEVPVGGVAVDSTGARTAGHIATTLLRHTTVHQVDDEQITTAQTWLWERVRILAEPGGAVALAALTSGTWEPPTTNSVTVVVVCGANTNHLPARPRNGPGR
jgi:threonine dehydratase